LVHWVVVDLAAPGIELYVTPIDPNAVARGVAISSAPNWGCR